jgi:nucleotide-binding universal stress UspA family protein
MGASKAAPRREGVRIVLALDGSAGAATALDALIALPLRRTDEVTVVAYPAYLLTPRPGGGGIISRLMQGQRAKAQAVVDAGVARIAAAHQARVSGLVPEGLEAVDAILRAAIDGKADLIVVGSRGLGPLSSVLVGSTARALAIMSPVPVLVVRDRRAAPRRVLVAFDGSDAAEAALSALERLPLPDGVTIDLLNVLPVREWSQIAPGTESEIADLREATERDEKNKADALVRTAAQTLHGTGKIETTVERGPVADTILSRAKTTDVDLIVLGSRGLAGPRRPVWGSTAGRVMVSAHCSVLVAPVPANAPNSGGAVPGAASAD